MSKYSQIKSAGSGSGKVFNRANESCSYCSLKPSSPVTLKNIIRTIYLAAKEILNRRVYRYLMAVFAVLFLAAFIIIPVLAVPSNTFKIQFSLYTVQNYFMLALLAFLSALLLLTNIYSYRKTSNYNRKGITANASIGSFSGLLASMFGAASCPICIASIFGFLGIGTVGFLIKYNWLVFMSASILMLFSLYFASKKVLAANINKS